MGIRIVTAPDEVPTAERRLSREKHLKYEKRQARRQDGSGFKEEFERACEDVRRREHEKKIDFSGHYRT